MSKIAELLRRRSKPDQQLDLLLVVGMSKTLLMSLPELSREATKLVIVDFNEVFWRKSIEQVFSANQVFESSAVTSTGLEQIFYSYNLLTYDGLTDFAAQPGAPKNLERISAVPTDTVTVAELVAKHSEGQQSISFGLILDIGAEGSAVLSSLPSGIQDSLQCCVLAPASCEDIDFSQLGLGCVSLFEEQLTAKKWLVLRPLNLAQNIDSELEHQREIQLALFQDENNLLKGQVEAYEKKVRQLTDELGRASEYSENLKLQGFELRQKVDDLNSQLTSLQSEFEQLKSAKEYPQVIEQYEDLRPKLHRLNAQVDLLKDLLFGRSESL